MAQAANSMSLLPSPRRLGVAQVAAAVLALALLFPLLQALAVALLSTEGRQALVDWSLSPRGWRLQGRTLGLALFSGAIAVALAWALVSAALVAGRNWLPVVLVGACLPLLVPSSVVGVAWIMALGRDGVATQWLRDVADVEAPTVYSLPVAAGVIAVRYLGVAALVLAAERLRQEATWPAERMFAVRPWTALLHLRLRAAVRPALLALALVTLLAAQDQILPSLLLISTAGTQVLLQYAALLSPEGAAAVALPTSALLAVVCLAALRGRGLTSADDVMTAASRPPRHWLLRAAAVGLILLLLGAMLLVPLAALMHRAGSLEAVRGAMAAAREEIVFTLVLSAVAAGICVLVGALLAGAWARASLLGQASLAPLALLNLLVPASLLGIGVATAGGWLPAPLRDGPGPLLLAYAARFAPLAALVLFAAWRQQPALAEHALDLFRVPLPQRLLLRWRQRRAALAGCWVLCVVLIATELDLSVLLVPPGTTTLGVRLYTLMHTAPDSIVSGLALGLLLLLAPALAGALAAGTLLSRTWKLPAHADIER